MKQEFPWDALDKALRNVGPKQRPRPDAFTASEYQARLNNSVTLRAVKYRLQRAVELGTLERTPRQHSGSVVYYWLKTKERKK